MNLWIDKWMSNFDEYQTNWNVGLIILCTKMNVTYEGLLVEQSVIELYETKP